jgi:hypothetical protein
MKHEKSESQTSRVKVKLQDFTSTMRKVKVKVRDFR